MTSLPTWAIYAVSFGSPLAAFLGVLIGHLVSRRGASELDQRGKREESMRTLRWASELAVADDDRTARLGVAALDALNAAPWLQGEDQAFIDRMLAALVRSRTGDYRRVEDADIVHVEDVADQGAADADVADREEH